jgi:ribose 5-phosphate isomerase B
VRIAFGSDEANNLTAAILEELRRRGHDVTCYGPPAGGAQQWAQVAEEVGRRVAGGEADQGVLCCWTGTGVSIAANKVAGVRAALCHDAETAKGARLWNDANVLCLSLRATSEAVAREVLDVWFATGGVDESEAENIERVKRLDQVRSTGQ